MAIVLMSDPVFDTEVIATAIDVWKELYRDSKKASTTTRSDKGLLRDRKVSDEPLGDLNHNRIITRIFCRGSRCETRCCLVCRFQMRRQLTAHLCRKTRSPH